MAGQYKNVTIDGKEIDSKGSLFQVLDNRDSGLPKNIPNVFKCNLARQDGSYKFFKNGLPVVWFAKLEDGGYERLATTESVLYKNADDVYFVDEAFNVTGVAYCFYEHVGNSGIEYVAAKIKELLEQDEFTILSGNNFEHANSESKFSILAEEEITSEKLSRGFVGCYNCNDGYPNNLEDCPYCSGRGRFYGTKAGWDNSKDNYYLELDNGNNNFNTICYAKTTTAVNSDYLANAAFEQILADEDQTDFNVKSYFRSYNCKTAVELLLGKGAIKETAWPENVNINVGHVKAKICLTCDGRGYIDGLYQKCNVCEGKGFVETGDNDLWYMDCIHCNDISNFNTKLPMLPFKNFYNKLSYNMTDEKMPIMRGKRIKNKIGYNTCDLCDGAGRIYSWLKGNDTFENNFGVSSPKYYAKFLLTAADNTEHLLALTQENIYVYSIDDEETAIRLSTLFDYSFALLNIQQNDKTITYVKAIPSSYDTESTPIIFDPKKVKLKIKYANCPFKTITCNTCNGTGYRTETNDSLCEYCEGRGVIRNMSESDYDELMFSFNEQLPHVISNLNTFSFKTGKIVDFAEELINTIKESGKIELNSVANPYFNGIEQVSKVKTYFADIFGTADIIATSADDWQEHATSHYFPWAGEHDHFWDKDKVTAMPANEFYYSCWGSKKMQTNGYGSYIQPRMGFSISGFENYAPCPKCSNVAFIYNNQLFQESSDPDPQRAIIAQRKLIDDMTSAAKKLGNGNFNYFDKTHVIPTDTDISAYPAVNFLGVTAFCDTCNPNGIPETHFKDGLIVSPNSQGIYPEGTETVVGLIDCNTCGNNGLEAGEMVCTGCLGIRHWFCTTCSGDGEVEYRPTVAYEDGKKVAVGDGYYYENLFPNATSAFNLYKDYINIKPNDNCDIGRGEYIKKMNLFSVENNGLLTVHNNNYDDVPTSDVKHNLNRDFFAVRDWAKYDSLDERFANLQNCCYAPDAIYFPKRTAHNEEWKLRIRELYYLITDSYIKTNASMLKTNALNQAIADFYTNNTTYLLKLGPIITYAIKGVWRKGAKGSKGVKGITAGTKGKKGMKGLKGLKGTKGAKGYYEKIVIENKRYKYTLPDILNAIYAEYGQRIMNSGNLGKDDKTYTFYCINEDSENYLWFKGVRIRQLTKGRYQTLNVVKGCKPYGVQRIVYKNNGYNGEYGVMNFQYSRNREFLT